MSFGADLLNSHDGCQDRDVMHVSVYVSSFIWISFFFSLWGSCSLTQSFLQCKQISAVAIFSLKQFIFLLLQTLTRLKWEL